MKRNFLAFVTIVVIVFNILSENVFCMEDADEYELSINGGKAVILYPDDTLTAPPADGYQWYYADSQYGDYIAIDGAINQNYAVKWSDEGKYIKCAMMFGNKEEYSESSPIVYKTEMPPVDRVNSAPAGWCMNTPDENIFVVDGKSFILLDTKKNDESKYFVMAKDFYGTHKFDGSKSGKFDINSKSNIAYWLNNELILPQPVLEHINFNRVWKTEAGYSKSTYNQAYYIKCGIALMSQTEWINYIGKFGVSDGFSERGWWLRSSRGLSNTENVLISISNYISGTTNWAGRTFNYSPSQEAGVRPVFYLDRSFFTDVKPEYLGQEVKKTIAQNYTSDEILKLYTMDEFENYGVFDSIIAINGKTKGIPYPDDTLSVAGAEGYQWYISDSKNGKYIAIDGENKKNYAVKWSDEGKYLKCERKIGNNNTFTESTESVYKTNFVGSKRIVTPPEGWQKDTPAENTFSLDGKNFILLDTKNNDESKFFVMSKDFYGKRIYDSDNTTRFDPDDENNIGYWLNHDLLTGDGQNLPIGIQRHINKERVWKTEPGHKLSNCPEEYYTQCGVALMSEQEWLQYTGKFGVKDSYSGIGWWLRTSRANTEPSHALMSIVDYSTGGILWMGQTSQNNADGSNGLNGVRPVFYLDRDFFTSVRINDIGSNVYKTIKDVYSAEELSSIYSAGELKHDFGYSVECDEGYIRLEQNSVGNRIKLLTNMGDGIISDEIKLNESCKSVSTSSQYMYFKLEDDWFGEKDNDVSIFIQFLDVGTDDFAVQYSSNDQKSDNPKYKKITVKKTDTGVWKTVRLDLNDALFTGLQNGGSSFRILSNDSGSEYIYSVQIIKNFLVTYENINIVSDKTGNVFGKNDAVFYVDIYQLLDKEPVDYKIKYTITDDLGNTSVKEKYFTVDFNKETRCELPLDIETYGVYNFVVEVTKGDIIKRSESINFGVAPDYEERILPGGAGFGVNLHMQKRSVNEIDLLKRAGIKLVRDGYTWGSAETEQGVYNHSRIDTVLKPLINNGMEIFFILGGPNKLYMSDEEKNIVSPQVPPKTDEALEAFGNYGAYIAKRYPEINMFEIWNEPDHEGTWYPKTNPSEYSNMLKKAADKIHEANPENKVYAQVTGSMYNSTFTNELFETGIYPYIDGFSHHLYQFTGDPQNNGYAQSVFKNGINTVYSYGGWKDICLSETGLVTTNSGNWFEVDKQTQAVRSIKSMIIAAANGNDKVIYYDFVDDGTDKSNKEQNFGILNYDYTPKNLYIAFVQMNQRLSGADFLGTIDIGTNSVGYVYMLNGQINVVAWAKETSEKVVLNGTEKIEDIYGNEISESAELGASPVYLIGVDKCYAIEAVKNTVALNVSDISGAQNISDISSCERMVWKNVEVGNKLIADFDDNENTMLALFKLYKANEAIAKLAALDSGFFIQNECEIQKSSNEIAKKAAEINKKVNNLINSGNENYIRLGYANILISKSLNEWAKQLDLKNELRIISKKCDLQKTELVFKNGSDTTKKFVVATAVYGKDGDLQKLDISDEVSIASGDEKAVSCECSGEKVKCFIWNSVSDMSPLMESVSF